MRISFAALALWIVALVPPSATIAAPVPDFHAVYRSVDGTVASMDVASSYDAASGAHTLVVSRVDDDGHEYVRTLRFSLVDERVWPLWYREEDCASCKVTVTFDWNRRLLGYDARGEQRFASTTERDGTPSRLVRDVAMLIAMLPGRRELVGFDDVLIVKALGTVELDTPLGRVHADGHALRGNWDQTVWLAPEFDLLPARTHAFGVTVALAELSGLPRSAIARAVEAPPNTVPEALSEAATDAIPEYRAVYRLDSGRKVGVGRYEVAVTHDRGADVYEFVATAVENKRPEEVLTFRMPFRLVGERVQPLALHAEDSGRRPFSVQLEFDWAVLEASARFNGRQLRYPLVDFDDRGQRSARIGLLEPLAGMLALLPGSRSISGMEDLLTVEPQGRSEVTVAMGSFAVERAVLLGKGEDTSAEVWRAGALAGLPIRFSGPLMARKATTMELIELHGIERAVAED